MAARGVFNSKEEGYSNCRRRAGDYGGEKRNRAAVAALLA